MKHALLILACSGALAQLACSPGRDITAPRAGTVLVDIRDNFFQTNTVTVPRGGYVRWTNRGQELHSVTGDAPSLRSPLMPPTTWFEAHFEQSGTYNYECSVHEEMTGTVIVQ